MSHSPPLSKWRTLRRGMKGPDVSAMQMVLESDGFSLDPYGPDGDFGGLTERKVQAWQQQRCLTPDGVFGALSRAKIGEEPEPADEAPGGLCQIMSDHGVPYTDSRVSPRPWPFNPVGIIVHHTASAGPGDVPSLGTILNGRPGLPGPLSQVLIGRLGTVHICTDCHANHAGPGREPVLERVRAGDPLTPEIVSWGVKDKLSGNSYFYGIECENNGTGEPWPAEQYGRTLEVVRAMLEAFSWSKYTVIGHLEWTRRKIDPSFSMDEFRRRL